MQTKLLGRHQNILHSFSLRERRGSNISRFVSLSNVFLSTITWFNSHIKKSKCIWWISESSICIFHLKQTDSKRLKLLHMFLEWKILHQCQKLDHENHIIIWSYWPFFCWTIEFNPLINFYLISLLYKTWAQIWPSVIWNI